MNSQNICFYGKPVRRFYNTCFYGELEKIIQELSPSTVDSRYLEFQGTFWNSSRYPYLGISELQR